MPVIARQHARDPWRPLMPWPDDCTVQWGGAGVVLGDAPYRTAFFEAFPGDGSAGFIRGEGATVGEAEGRAHSTYLRQSGCAVGVGHRWTRARRIAATDGGRRRKGRAVPKVSTYDNGGTFCLRCGAFATTMMPVHRLGDWRAPLSAVELDSLMGGLTRPGPGDDGDAASRRWRRVLHLKARVAGIPMPDPLSPSASRPEGLRPFAEDPFQRRCRDAVVRWYVGGGAAGGQDACGASRIAGLLDSLALRRLEAEAAQWRGADGAD